MAEILDRKEWGHDGSLALDLSCGCIVVLPKDCRALAAGKRFTCPKCARAILIGWEASYG